MLALPSKEYYLDHSQLKNLSAVKVLVAYSNNLQLVQLLRSGN